MRPSAPRGTGWFRWRVPACAWLMRSCWPSYSLFLWSIEPGIIQILSGSVRLSARRPTLRRHSAALGANAAGAERPAMVFTQRSGAVSCRASIAGGLHMLSRCLRATLGGVALFASSMAFAQIEHYPSEQGRVSIEEVVGGLAFPWSLAFLPDGKRMLVT